MMRARSMIPQASEMVRRGIAPMTGKAVLGKFPVQLVHDPVARHLGQDTGGSNAQADPVPADQSGLLHRESLGRKPVDQSMSGRRSLLGENFQGPAHGKVGGPEDIEIPDLNGTRLGDGIADVRMPGDHQEEFLALGGRELLGVIHPGQGDSLRQYDGGRNDGAGKRSPASLVDSGHGTDPAADESGLMAQVGPGARRSTFSLFPRPG